MSPSAYAAWSKDDLIARIQSLEAVLASDPKIPPDKIPRPQIPATTQQASQKKSKKEAKPFDINAYPKRKIALKFCYAGWEYNGLAFQTDPTPLPMVEAVLLKALGDCRLIDPELGLEGCGWSRCGRTDKGVSGAGQVVSLWIRSAIGAKSGARKKNLPVGDLDTNFTSEASELTTAETEDAPSELTPSESLNPHQSELRYVAMLNSVLPRSIRILAWSPVVDDFDARFTCTFRHYKYFFSTGYPPYPHLTISPSSPSAFALLDVEAMQDAASRLVGNHDFRNFCKIDPSKQVDNYTRRITDATITPLHDSVATTTFSPLYVLDLKGTGFLYHQVRHIMAILFLVGARLEPPSIVDTLLDAQTITRKPVYEMADGLPLVLWDCGYPDGSLSWRVDDSDSANPESASKGKAGGPQSAHNLFYDFDLLASQSRTKTIMMEHFAQAAEVFHSPPPPPGAESGVFRAPLGGGMFLQSALSKYVKLLDRPRGERSEDVNERWRTGAGARRKERREARAAAAVTETATGPSIESPQEAS